MNGVGEPSKSGTRSARSRRDRWICDRTRKTAVAPAQGQSLYLLDCCLLGRGTEEREGENDGE